MKSWESRGIPHRFCLTRMLFRHEPIWNGIAMEPEFLSPGRYSGAGWRVWRCYLTEFLPLTLPESLHLIPGVIVFLLLLLLCPPPRCLPLPPFCLWETGAKAGTSTNHSLNKDLPGADCVHGMGCTLKQTLQIISKQSSKIMATASSLTVRLCRQHTLTQLKFIGNQDLVSFFFLFSRAPFTAHGTQWKCDKCLLSGQINEWK